MTEFTVPPLVVAAVICYSAVGWLRCVGKLLYAWELKHGYFTYPNPNYVPPVETEQDVITATQEAVIDQAARKIYELENENKALGSLNSQLARLVDEARSNKNRG